MRNVIENHATEFRFWSV